jgi:catechol 2,3-dioxygenase-like lactoylglutathione lyase family enzyme
MASALRRTPRRQIVTIELTENHVEVGITVSDIAASLSFYCETLGFVEVATMPVEWGGTLHMLRLGDAVIKLASNDEIPKEANPPGGAAGATGLRWITLWVKDLDGVVDACSRANRPIPGPINSNYPGVKFAMVEDPDGNWIEFVEALAE